MKLSTVLALLPSLASANFYASNPNVFELTADNFESVVTQYNQTALVEFYAPWCGHCQSLKPEYNKVGKALKDIAIVGAVNCDLDKNKPLCAKQRVQGYPTLMVFRPPKYDLTKKQDAQSGRKYGFATETYPGPRKAKNLIDYVTGRMKNYVKRIVTEEKLQAWLKDGAKGHQGNDRLKMVVFTKRDKLAPMLKAIASDHLEHLDIAYFPIKANTRLTTKLPDALGSLEKAQVWVYPTGELGEGVPYQGAVDKTAIAEFLKQFDATKGYIDPILKVYQRLERIITGKKKKGSAAAAASRGRKDEL